MSMRLRRCASSALSTGHYHQSAVPHISQHGLRRFFASPTADAYRRCRDIASALDAPQNKDPTPRNIEIHAHVRTVRAQKKRAFVALGDGSTARSLQVLLDPSQASHINTGTAVRIRGSWIPSPARGQSHELHASSVEILGLTDPESFPVQKQHLKPEFLRTIPHLRVRTTGNALLTRLRSETEHQAASFFRQDGFVRLHPPAITSSDCEGAGEVFVVRPKDERLPAGPVTHGANTDQIKGQTSGEEFFKSPKYLTVSNQLHLEAFVHEHQRVWALAPTFRAERSDTPRHLSEFYMLEAEFRCESLDAVMDFVENLVRDVAKNIQDSSLGKEFLTKSSHAPDEKTEELRLKTLGARYRGLRQPYWPRIKYTQAITLLKEAAKEDPGLFSVQPSWETGLQLQHEKYIASTVGNGSPVFVTDYPKHQKPFYMLPSSVSSPEPRTNEPQNEANGQRWQPHAMPATPSREEQLQQAHPTVACFDLLLPDMGELVGGSLREHRLDALQAAMQERQVANIDWYLDLRKYGSVPHGGFGLGFDRLLMYLSGADSVRDVVQWPRYYGKCDA